MTGTTMGRKKKGIYINCKTCEKSFYIKPCHIGQKFYCSLKCAYRGRIKHGDTRGRRNEKKRVSRLWRIWRGMRNRCLKSSYPEYSRYGGRGITICKEWLDYSNFKKWAKKNGYSNSLTIDRIDNDKGYFPDNCRWATRTEQQRNRRDNICLTFKGKTLLLVEWAEKLNIPLGTLYHRKCKTDMSDEEIITGRRNG